MPARPLPDEIIERFRVSSRDRLARVEAVWAALIQGAGDEQQVSEMHRHVHTLKGDAQLVEFTDISLLCQKLEDLLGLAADLRYQIHDDLDLAVTMAIDFLGLLLRRKTPTPMAGIDLDGFVSQVETVVREARQSSPGTPLPAAVPDTGRVTTDGDGEKIRVTTRGRNRLAVAATNAFLEYLGATGSSRTRLRNIWLTLQREIEQLDSVSVKPLIERHVAAVPELAESLGKQVRVISDVQGDPRMGARALEALDVAMVHVLRNAIDHGIESAEQREASGKSAVGMIQVRVRADGELVEVCVEDDGRGVDLDSVRARAVERGILHPDIAAQASEAMLLDILFQPRFSTRAEASDISGRGVGLDAVRTTVTQTGGTVTLSARGGRGTAATIRLPLVVRRLEVLRFASFGGKVSLAVSSDWAATDLGVIDVAGAIDPLGALQVKTPADQTGLVSMTPPRVLQLHSAYSELRIIAGGSPEQLTAHRICPTPEDCPVEVVAIAGGEVLLLRPDRLPVPTDKLPTWQ